MGMRDHPKNREHAHGEGDCKWRCDNDDRCARYEYDALTLSCKMFEKPKDDLNQENEDISGEDDTNDQGLIVSKAKSGFELDSDQDDKDNSEKKKDSSIEDDSDDCGNACYNGKHAGVPWQDHKCTWKRCSGCHECLTAQTSAVSEAALVAKPESKSKKASVNEEDSDDCGKSCY